LVLATTNWRRIAGVSWRVAAAFLIAALPLVWAAARLVASGDYVSQQYAWRNAPTGVDLLSPLIGSPVPPLGSGVSGRAYAAFGDNFIEAVGWLGVVPLLLAAGVRAAAARAWRVTAAVFFVWALGPFLRIGGFDTGLKLPAILLRFVPFVANARMLG